MTSSKTVDLHPLLTWHAVQRFIERAMGLSGGVHFKALHKRSRNETKVYALCRDNGLDPAKIMSAMLTPDVIAAITEGASKIILPELNVRYLMVGYKVVTVKPNITGGYKCFRCLSDAEARRNRKRHRKR